MAAECWAGGVRSADGRHLSEDRARRSLSELSPQVSVFVLLFRSNLLRMLRGLWGLNMVPPLHRFDRSFPQPSPLSSAPLSRIRHAKFKNFAWAISFKGQSWSAIFVSNQRSWNMRQFEWSIIFIFLIRRLFFLRLLQFSPGFPHSDHPPGLPHLSLSLSLSMFGCCSPLLQSLSLSVAVSFSLTLFLEVFPSLSHSLVHIFPVVHISQDSLFPQFTPSFPHSDHPQSHPCLSPSLSAYLWVRQSLSSAVSLWLSLSLFLSSNLSLSWSLFTFSL